MALLKTEDEITRLRVSGERLARVLVALMEKVVPGMSTWDVDQLAEKLIRQSGGDPIFKGYAAGGDVPFPGSICASLNEEVVHGIPSKERILREGDLFKIDIGMRYQGMVTDMARTMAIGKISLQAQKLLEVTRTSLERGVAALKPGATLNDYGRVVQKYIEKNNFSVVRDVVGHGVGHELHERPQVPNYVMRGNDVRIQKGMALALEPMVNAGSYHIVMAPDQWTLVTEDGSLSAHFEDTVVITEKGAEVITKI